MLIGPQNPGRAPKVPAILVRLTAEDYLSVAEAAAAEGQSLSGFVRRLVRGQLAEQSTPAPASVIRTYEAAAR